MTAESVLRYAYAIRRVGHWFAQYVLLGELARAHIFPGDDSRAQRNPQKLSQLDRGLMMRRQRGLRHARRYIPV